MQRTTPSSWETGNNELGSLIWSIAILLGVLQIILGLFLVTAPGMTTLLLVQFLGIYWLALGVISIIQIFTSQGRVHWGWLLFSGILGIIAGFLVLRHPFLGAVVTVGFLTYLVVFAGLVRGVIGLVQGIKGEGGWNIFFGIILILVSRYLLFNPLGAFIALPVVIGFLALIGGSGLVFWGMEIRNKITGFKNRMETLHGMR